MKGLGGRSENLLSHFFNSDAAGAVLSEKVMRKNCALIETGIVKIVYLYENEFGIIVY